MQLVIRYSSNSHTETSTFRYDSKEKAIQDIKSGLYKAYGKCKESVKTMTYVDIVKAKHHVFQFEGLELPLRLFCGEDALQELPEIMTVDEWFDGIISNNENTN